MKVAGSFAVAVVVTASPCPFAPASENLGHFNAEGVCASCDASLWYATDGKCSCGTSDADWITDAQWNPCPLVTEDLEVAVEVCPFTQTHYNAEGDCATCFKSQWYDTDHKCSCGPSQADWITVDQVRICPVSEDLKAAAEVCPFTQTHFNVEGDCATCFKSQWYDADHKCSCGPSQADWITVDQVRHCPVSEDLKAAPEVCPFAQTHYNAEGDCATCFKSQWFDTDRKCVCGPSKADWITVDQVSICPVSEDLKAEAEVCPFTPTHYNAEGDCATCFKSQWYDTDHKCSCGPSQADWITVDQVRICPVYV